MEEGGRDLLPNRGWGLGQKGKEKLNQKKMEF